MPNMIKQSDIAITMPVLRATKGAPLTHDEMDANAMYPIIIYKIAYDTTVDFAQHAYELIYNQSLPEYNVELAADPIVLTMEGIGVGETGYFAAKINITNPLFWEVNTVAIEYSTSSDGGIAFMTPNFDALYKEFHTVEGIQLAQLAPTGASSFYVMFSCDATYQDGENTIAGKILFGARQ